MSESESVADTVVSENEAEQEEVQVVKKLKPLKKVKPELLPEPEEDTESGDEEPAPMTKSSKSKKSDSSKGKKSKKTKVVESEDEAEQDNQADESEEEDKSTKSKKKSKSDKSKVSKVSKKSKIKKTESEDEQSEKEEASKKSNSGSKSKSSDKIKKKEPLKTLKSKKAKDAEPEEEDDPDILSLDALKKQTQQAKSWKTLEYLSTAEVAAKDIIYSTDGFKLHEASGGQYCNAQYKKGGSVAFQTKALNVKSTDFCVNSLDSTFGFTGSINIPIDDDADLVKILTGLDVNGKQFALGTEIPDEEEDAIAAVVAEINEKKYKADPSLKEKKKGKQQVSKMDLNMDHWLIGKDKYYFKGGNLVPGMHGKENKYKPAFEESKTGTSKKKGTEFTTRPKFTVKIVTKKQKDKAGVIIKDSEEIITKNFMYTGDPFSTDKEVAKQGVIKKGKSFKTMKDVQEFFHGVDFTCVMNLSYTGMSYHKFGISHIFNLQEIYFKKQDDVVADDDFSIKP